MRGRSPTDRQNRTTVLWLVVLSAGGFGRGHLKRIAEPVDCAHEARMRRIISEGLSNLGDEIHQILLDHEGVGPEALLKGDLRECLGSIRDEHLQQLIRFRSERDTLASSKQLPRVQIQHEVEASTRPSANCAMCSEILRPRHASLRRSRNAVIVSSVQSNAPRRVRYPAKKETGSLTRTCPARSDDTFGIEERSPICVPAFSTSI